MASSLLHLVCVNTCCLVNAENMVTVEIRFLCQIVLYVSVKTHTYLITFSISTAM